MPYLTPESIPEGTVCRPLFIPDDTQWLAIVSGAITELLYKSSWEQFGAVTPSEAIARMQLMVDQYYAGDCGVCTVPDGQPILRISLFGHFEQLANGEWVEPPPDYQIPPPTAREEPTPEDRICLAAKNAANVLKQLYEEVSDAVGEGLTIVEMAAQVAAVVSGIIAPVVGLAVTAIFAFSTALIKFLAEAVEFITADVWTSEFDEGLVCLLIDAASDDAGVVTFDYDGFVEGLYAATYWNDPAGYEQRLAGQIVYLLQIIGIDGLNLAGRTTAIDDDDCSFCSPGWCYTWDFTVNSGGWFAESGLGDYVSGVGWKAVDVGSAKAMFLRVDLPVTNSLRDFIITFTQVGAVNAVRRAFYYNGSYVPLSVLQTSGEAVDETTAVFDDTTTVDVPNLLLNWSADNSSAEYVITAITLRGDFDPNPFGDDNCT